MSADEQKKEGEAAAPVRERDLSAASPEQLAALETLRERLPAVLAAHPGVPESLFGDWDLLRYVATGEQKYKEPPPLKMRRSMARHRYPALLFWHCCGEETRHEYRVCVCVFCVKH
jgi:hypothetical protein